MTAALHRLLVIDDSPTIRKLVELSFRGAPFVLDFATTGAEGLGKAAQAGPDVGPDGGPDVILLDCVLPDMKAGDVCQRLPPAASGDPRGARPRVILMSAKDRESLQELFERYPQVIDFVAKPFTADEIVARVKAAAAGQPARALATEPTAPSPGAAVPGAHGLGPQETQAAAKALYARLARPLASVPEWVRQAGAPGAASPASLPAFLARKLLTPELVSSLLEALLPIYKQALRAERPAAPAPAPAPDPDAAAPLQGQVIGWPLNDLLAIVGASGRTGELALTHGAQRLVTYWESGEMVLCTSHDPADYVRRGDARGAAGEADPGGEAALVGVAADARARAEAEQQASATPLHVTLFEAQALPASVDLCGLLHQRGVRLLHQARGAQSVRYVWRDRAALPAYALGWGRHLALTDDRELPGVSPPLEPTIAQLGLERLRRPSAWSEVDARLPPPEQCYERASGFSNKLRALRLTASEQRVLALVERHITVRAIALRSGLPAREVARIAYRLAESDLIQALPLPAPSASPSVSSSASPSASLGTGERAGGGSVLEPAARSVMILDPDDQGFCQPLRDRLARRPRPVSLLDLSGELDLTDAISRERPGLVVLSETAAPGRLAEIARAVRATPHLAGTALAAVLDGDAGTSADALAAAGFDAVWSKPIHYLDLIALLATAEPAPWQPPSHSHPNP